MRELKAYKDTNEKVEQYDKLLLMINKDSSDNIILRKENE